MSAPSDPQPKPPSTGDLIAQLLGSGDAWVKLITLALIILTGSTNWFATKNVGDESRAEWTQSMKEIHQFFANQQTYLEGLKALAQNNQDTATIRAILEQNAAGIKAQNAILEALKAEQKPPPTK